MYKLEGKRRTEGEMTLQESLQEVKVDVADGGYFEEGEYYYTGITEAIATILNAVVKGELKNECL